MKKDVGLTKQVGFQFGIRKTISVSTEKAWKFLFSEAGINIWLGQLESKLEYKKEYTTKNKVTGVVRVFKVNSHIRLSWKPYNWNNVSTIQIRVIGNKDKTIIAIHQEKLLNSNQRNNMKEYWTKIMNELITALEIT